MPLELIEKKYFLSPREAVEEVIGPAMYGDGWRRNMSLKDAQFKHATSNLRKILQSGDVDATYSLGGGPEKKLTYVQTSSDYFVLDTDRDCCYFLIEKHPPYEIKIRRGSLVAFVKKFQGNETKGVVSAETRCEKWLLGLFRDGGPIPINKVLFDEANRRFGSLSQRGFARARGKAVAASGEDKWTMGGRPMGRRNLRSSKTEPSH